MDGLEINCASQIKELIIKGELKEGDPLPSIRNLARKLKISVITTKKAYEVLGEDGFIEKITGRGSFVASQNKELLREKRLKNVEENLLESVKEAQIIGLSRAELIEMLEILSEEV
ncbi:MAG: GntR family transcriptional regulator [Halanaerobium sp.]|nr:GntR family transcriptional regulator [Halanaerobium sp.]